MIVTVHPVIEGRVSDCLPLGIVLITRDLKAIMSVDRAMYLTRPPAETVQLKVMMLRRDGYSVLGSFENRGVENRGGVTFGDVIRMIGIIVGEWPEGSFANWLTITIPDATSKEPVKGVL